MKIQSIHDAKTLVNNGGVTDWEFGGNASLDGLTEFVYRNSELFVNRDDDSTTAELTDSGLRAYLVSVGEIPADYNL